VKITIFFRQAIGWNSSNQSLANTRFRGALDFPWCSLKVRSQPGTEVHAGERFAPLQLV
jgi:hypothetical protein